MLKAKEIETLIKQKRPLPPKADDFEKFYYYALDICIEMYRHKKLSRDDLRLYQREYKKTYEQMIMWYEILKKHRETEKILGHAELNIDGCEKCRQVARILDGRLRSE